MTTEPPTTYPVAIVGAGPLGIELAVALRRAGLEPVHFDAGQVGQTIAWFPPGTRFFSSNERIAIAGVPLQTPDQTKATREQYLAYLRSVVQQFDVPIHTYERVEEVHRADGAFTLVTSHRGHRRAWRASRIVLATGGTARPRRLGVPGEDLPHVHPFWKDPHDYFRTDVLVVGGKNSAVEAALRFHHAGARVALSYRGAELPHKSIKYWLMPEISALIKSGAMGAYFETVPVEITPAHVALASVRTGERTTIPADFVVPQIGYVADMALAKLAGVDLRGDRLVPAYDPQTMQTNVPGVYVCGTVTGGTQDKYEIFIENGHVHVDRIVNHVLGRHTPVGEIVYPQPES